MRPVKMLMAVDAARCAGSHVSTTVNGVTRAPFMLPSPPVSIVTPLPKDVDGTVICLTLRAPCSTPERLCYGSAHCWYAFLDADKGDGCCVVDHV